MCQVEGRRDRQGFGRKVWVTAPDGGGQRGVDADRGAVVTVVVRVVVTLLVTRVDAVAQGGVEDAVGPVGATTEATSADENEHARGRRLRLAVATAVAAGHIRQRDA